MRVAIVHDWLTFYGGAERVLSEIIALFPEADLFSLVDFVDHSERGFLRGKIPTTSFIQRLPFAKNHYRQYLPLMPLAIEQFDLSAYDLVISSSYAVAKGVLTGPNQTHVSYIHSPARYAWDLYHQYMAGIRPGLKKSLVRACLHGFRIWDNRTTNGIDAMVANSRFIARRIWKVYRRRSDVIYPPVAIDDFAIADAKEDYYVTVSRLVPYKRVDVVIKAFSTLPQRRLIVIGDGPDFKKLKAIATPNVEMLGFQPQEELRRYLSRARAFVFAAEEDFGIAPVEAQASGTPVIALGKGGVRETVREWPRPKPTGVFFNEPTPESLREAINTFERNADSFSPRACREHAARYSEERFRSEFRQMISDSMKKSRDEDNLLLEEALPDDSDETLEMDADVLTFNRR